MVDGNNHYDMTPPGQRSSSAAASSAAGKCTRPSPSGGTCKNKATPGTLFCRGHTCPVQGCTAGKSAKMATCPLHVHSSTAAGPRPAEGEVFYDASAGTGDGAYAEVPALHLPTANNDVYAVSTKQQAKRGEQDYVTLNEMPPNSSA